MKKGTWWNEPMTRKNWAVLIVLSFVIGLVEAGYIMYSKSIKSDELIRKVKEMF